MINSNGTNQTDSANRNGIIIYTIGFTKKSAREFFETLRKAGVQKVIDIRLNNASQLAGFTKKEDLAYFLQSIAGIGYEHRTELAPTEDILNGYKKKNLTWQDYEQRFNALLAQRQVEHLFKPENLHQSCLLCSEPKAEKCHRRLVAEYFKKMWGNVSIRHL